MPSTATTWPPTQLPHNKLLAPATGVTCRRAAKGTQSRLGSHSGSPSRLRGLGARKRSWGAPKAVVPPDQVCYTPCVTSNTVNIGLRRSKAEVEVKARPNLNAWVNQLIEQALGLRSADWNGRPWKRTLAVGCMWTR
jgi:hypothetical protein